MQRPSRSRKAGERANASEDNTDDLDLFLDEERLIELARAHLGGRLPPGFNPYQSKSTLFPGAPRDVGLSRSKRDQDSNSNKHITGLERNSGRERRRLSKLLSRELEARGWTPEVLASETGFSVPECHALVRGNAPFSRVVAETLGRVFATSLQEWLPDDLKI